LPSIYINTCTKQQKKILKDISSTIGKKKRKAKASAGQRYHGDSSLGCRNK
jgi:hypothetical protein